MANCSPSSRCSTAILPCCSHSICYLLFAFSSLHLLYISYYSVPALFKATSYSCPVWQESTAKLDGGSSARKPPSSATGWVGHLYSLPFAWNHLTFPPLSSPPPRPLNLALFVKRWPRGDRAGGMERHALTLHLALARRGHTTHVFSSDPGGANFSGQGEPNLYYHFSPPSASGAFDQRKAWEQFVAANATKPFDVVHSESVGLPHANARGVPNVVVSWQGIGYEAVHSEIAQDVARLEGEARGKQEQQRLAGYMFKVIEEVRFFDHYEHHVATSDHVGDVLRRVYMIPGDRVHVILNGVDEGIFRQDVEKGRAFRRQHRVPESAETLVLGMSGRLVKDKGHPLMVEALNQIRRENATLLSNVFFLIAGDGPWGSRYKELGPNFRVLGPLDRPALSGFYNALDGFVHPTLRAQGLDQTVLEAMLTGKAPLVARFAGMTESAVVGEEVGYVFSPKVERLKEALYRVVRDGKAVLEKKGEAARHRAERIFTATKMAAAYERLFLCVATSYDGRKGEHDDHLCRYPFTNT